MSVSNPASPTYADIFQDFTKNSLTLSNLFQMVHKKCLELESTVQTLRLEIEELKKAKAPAEAGGKK